MVGSELVIFALWVCGCVAVSYSILGVAVECGCRELMGMIAQRKGQKGVLYVERVSGGTGCECTMF
jgi:hypothetical protein